MKKKKKNFCKCSLFPFILIDTKIHSSQPKPKTLASDPTLRQASGLPSLYYHHSSTGLPTNPSPTPSTNSHRSGGSYFDTFHKNHFEFFKNQSCLIYKSIERCIELQLFNFNDSVTVSYPTHSHGFGGQTANNYTANSGMACLPTRAVHERSHSDGTTAPLPSVDLSMESSSVTSLSNLPLRKHAITSGKHSNHVN